MLLYSVEGHLNFQHVSCLANGCCNSWSLQSWLSKILRGWRVLTWGSLDNVLLITVVLSRVRPSVTTKGELVKDGAQCFKFLKFGQILSCKQGSST
jgi:hypothetical protein